MNNNIHRYLISLNSGCIAIKSNLIKHLCIVSLIKKFIVAANNCVLGNLVSNKILRVSNEIMVYVNDHSYRLCY